MTLRRKVGTSTAGKTATVWHATKQSTPRSSRCWMKSVSRQSGNTAATISLHVHVLDTGYVLCHTRAKTYAITTMTHLYDRQTNVLTPTHKQHPSMSQSALCSLPSNTHLLLCTTPLLPSSTPRHLLRNVPCVPRHLPQHRCTSTFSVRKSLSKNTKKRRCDFCCCGCFFFL